MNLNRGGTNSNLANAQFMQQQNMEMKFKKGQISNYDKINSTYKLNSLKCWLTKENPENSSPFMLFRMNVAVVSGGVTAVGSLLNWESKFSAFRGSVL